MKTILVTPRGYAKYGNEARKRLEALGYVMDINDTGKPLSREVFVKKAKQATGIIVGIDECDGNLLKECKNLKAIVKFGVGTDNIDLPIAEACNISVGRCVGSNANAVAEYSVGLMFSAARYISSANHDVKNGGWKKPTGYELLGKTVGIIGFGNIGKQVARICRGIGMKVLAYDTFDISDEVLAEYNAQKREVSDLLKESDFITIHVPLTKDTENMISKDQFNMMKKEAILINAARGGVVDEKALLQALKDKEIFACASDVFTSEPPVAEGWVNELIQMDSFILTPHIASRSAEAELNTVNMATDVMIELLNKHN